MASRNDVKKSLDEDLEKHLHIAAYGTTGRNLSITPPFQLLGVATLNKRVGRILTCGTHLRPWRYDCPRGFHCGIHRLLCYRTDVAARATREPFVLSNPEGL